MMKMLMIFNINKEKERNQIKTLKGKEIKIMMSKFNSISLRIKRKLKGNSPEQNNHNQVMTMKEENNNNQIRKIEKVILELIKNLNNNMIKFVEKIKIICSRQIKELLV